MNVITDYNEQQLLENTPVEVCPGVTVRALTISEGADWCRRARAAVGHARTAHRLRQESARVTAAEVEDVIHRAEQSEDRYFDTVYKLTDEFLSLTGQTKTLGELTPVQAVEVFEVAFQLSDPMAASTLSRLRKLQAIVADNKQLKAVNA